MGLRTSASEKVRVAAETEMPEKVGKREGGCVPGVKGGEWEGAVVQTLCPPQKPHSSTQGTCPTFGCLGFCFVVIFL